MAEWLPEESTAMKRLVEESRDRALEVLPRRIARDRKITRAVQWTAASLLVVTVAILLAPRFDDHGHLPLRTTKGPDAVAQSKPAREIASAPALSSRPETSKAAPGAVTASAVLARPAARTPDITLKKAGDAVALTWSGNPDRRYVVLRCTSPRFEACDRVAVVKGTQWVDPNAAKSPLVFYRVIEERKGA